MNFAKVGGLGGDVALPGPWDERYGVSRGKARHAELVSHCTRSGVAI